MKNAVSFSLWTLLLWFLIHTLYSFVDGMRDAGASADYAVVMGTTVREDGMLSPRLEQRMECALKLYEQGRVKGLIVSGGIGDEGFYEGTRLKDYLRARGVPDSVIVVDDSGNNTRMTAKNVAAMRDTLGYERLIVVSQYFHVTRVKMAFRKEGIQNVASVAPLYFELRDLYSVPREFMAFYTQIW